MTPVPTSHIPSHKLINDLPLQSWIAAAADCKFTESSCSALLLYFVTVAGSTRPQFGEQAAGFECFPLSFYIRPVVGLSH
jgi:hypothetical protein